MTNNKAKPKAALKRAPSGYRNSDLTIPARAASVGLSLRGLYKELERGRGPKITYLSERRRVILDADWNAWLRERADSPPPEVMRGEPHTKRNAARAAAKAEASAP
jgi:hypothetical protein